MSKKVSLINATRKREEFVRSGELPASHIAVSTSVQQTVNTENKKATFNLDANLHQHLKVTAAVQRREMVELVEEALQTYFGWNRMTDIEQKELKTYEVAERQGRGQTGTTDFNAYVKAVESAIGSEDAIAAQLLEHLEAQGRLVVEVWDGHGYQRLTATTHKLLYSPGMLHLKLTIPGRIRYQQLQQRQEWDRKQESPASV